MRGLKLLNGFWFLINSAVAPVLLRRMVVRASNFIHRGSDVDDEGDISV